jgi:hypothetical protein
MSDPETKLSRSKRISKTKSKGIKRHKIATKVTYWFEPPPLTNKFSDRAWYVNCGNSNCMLCGNPRKYFGVKTLHEQSAEELEKISQYLDLLSSDDD